MAMNALSQAGRWAGLITAAAQMNAGNSTDENRPADSTPPAASGGSSPSANFRAGAAYSRCRCPRAFSAVLASPIETASTKSRKPMKKGPMPDWVKEWTDEMTHERVRNVPKIVSAKVRITRTMFQTFSMAYTARVLSQLKRSHEGNVIPSIVFTKGGGLWLHDMAPLDCEVLGLDWTMNLGTARGMVGGKPGGPGKALQGNIDPHVLFAPPAQITQEVHRVLESFGTPHTDPTTPGPTHIFNLGHGISQFTPPDHVSALVEAVHTHSRAMRQGAIPKKSGA